MVIERLRRIEALEREGTHPRTLLAEVQALLAEADAWLAAEGSPTRAERALDRCREMFSGELAAEHRGGRAQRDAGLVERGLLGREALEADPRHEQRLRDAAA